MITTAQLRESPEMSGEEPKRARASLRRSGRSGGRTEALVA